MPVQNGMGEPALDFHTCHRGFYAAIETKAPGKKPTPRQMQTIRMVRSSGGSIFVIDNTNGADMAALIMWLSFPRPETLSPTVIQLLGEPNESRDDRFGDAEHAE